MAIRDKGARQFKALHQAKFARKPINNTFRPFHSLRQPTFGACHYAPEFQANKRRAAIISFENLTNQLTVYQLII